MSSFKTIPSIFQLSVITSGVCYTAVNSVLPGYSLKSFIIFIIITIGVPLIAFILWLISQSLNDMLLKRIDAIILKIEHTRIQLENEQAKFVKQLKLKLASNKQNFPQQLYDAFKSMPTKERTKFLIILSKNDHIKY